MKTTHLPTSALRTRADFDAAVDRFARATLRLRRAEAIRDTQLRLMHEKYDAPCAACAAELAALAPALQRFAARHRADLLPGRARSVATDRAVFGFRLGLPTLKPLDREWTWARVLAELGARGLARFVRTRHEPDKDAIKRHFAPGELAAIGCRIEQTETFFIEPREERTELRAA